MLCEANHFQWFVTGVPAVMMFCGASNRGRLQRQGITMHALDCLKSVGEVEICVLDKTGTLTGSVVRSDCPPVLAQKSKEKKSLHREAFQPRRDMIELGGLG